MSLVLKKIDHLGYACEDIEASIVIVKRNHFVETVSEIIFDQYQNAYVCYLTTKDGPNIELVSGQAVENILEKGLSLYHTCYVVDNLEFAINTLQKSGGVLVKKPYPALLFNNRKVAFLQTELGLIELLEAEKCTISEVNNKLKVCLAGTYNISYVLDSLKSIFEGMCLPFLLEETSYNQIMQTLYDKTSIFYQNKVGYNIILLRLFDWFNFVDLNHLSLADCRKLLETNVDELLNGIKIYNESEIPLIVCFCPTIHTPIYALSNELNELMYDFEQRIIYKINQYNNIVCSSTLLKISKESIYDEQADKIGNLPYNICGNQLIALELARILHSLIRKPYKVIVVDCDNTLWEGICGEEHPDNIKFTKANLKLQETLLMLSNKGILICLCSKNNEKDVLDIYKRRKEMLLTLENITHCEINWETKSKNIRKLSKSLNISLDDFIFIDDNPTEISEVTSQLPQILCLQFPRDEKEALRFIERAWCFDVNLGSDYDKKRTIFYQSNIQREQLKELSNNFEDFLARLELKIDIKSIKSDDYQRIAQLSQRTNQFNFTNIRRSVNEIKEILSKKNILGYNVKISDRFGDYGLVGSIIVELTKDHLIVDSFLLSCRVLGKGVEYHLLKEIVKVALENNKEFFMIKFKHSAKNTPAFNFINSLPLVKSTEVDNYLLFKYKTQDLLEIKYIPQEKQSENIDSVETYMLSNNSRLQDNNIIKKVIDGAYENFNDKKPEPLKEYNLEDIQNYLILTWNKILIVTASHEDNFFSLGGDSLLAVRVISKIKKQFGLDVDLDAIFNYPVLSHLAKYLFDSRKMINSVAPIYVIEKSVQYKLSYTQEWLCHLDQFDNGNSWYYNMPYVLNLKGKLNVEALDYALTQLIMRHDILRLFVAYNNGVCEAKFHDKINTILNVVKYGFYTEENLREMIDHEYRKPFDLTKDILIRAHLFNLSFNHNILLIVTHHIIFDGWSYTIMNTDLTRFYKKYIKCEEEIQKSSLQFFDYISWERQYLENIIPKQLEFWYKYLEQLPNPSFPLDMPRNRRTHEGKYLPIIINKNISSFMLSISHQQNVSLFSVMILVYAIQISKRSNSKDVVVVCPVSGRRHTDAEELIGCFVNIIVFRFEIDLLQSFLFNLTKNRKNIVDALNNQDIPFGLLLTELQKRQSNLDLSLFQVMFAFQNTSNTIINFPEVQASLYQMGYDAARLEFILELEQKEKELVGGVYYNTSLFKKNTILNFIDEYVLLCEQIGTYPENSLTYFWSNKKKSFLKTEINYTNTDFKDIISWFESIVIKFPENIAIQSAEKILTYRQLNHLANQFALYLKDKGVKENSIVAIMLAANSLNVVSILAIMKLGAVYLPLDVLMPEAYLLNIINDSKTSFFICEDKCSWQITTCLSIKINLSFFKKITNYSPKNLNINQRKNAYIIYTSGTTGKPKGVKIPHKNIVQLMLSTENFFKFNSQDTVLLFHSIAFDFSVWEMWAALCYGGKLVIPSRNQVKSPQEIHEIIFKEKVTVLNQTPTAFKQFCLYMENIDQSFLNHLRLIIFGGEKLLPLNLLWFHQKNPHVELYNLYGITETTVHATIKKISKNDMTMQSNIGKPLPGRSIYLLDDFGNMVDEGEIGEIYVSGLGLSQGYVYLDQKTSEVFLPDIYNNSHLMYKTGDLARIINGELEYIGRKDKQVQLRGFRIELEGIENTLSKHVAVKYAAVSCVEDNLVVFIVPNFKKVLPFVCQENLESIFILPNGMPIYHLNKNETEFLYEEIFERNEYLLAGIKLSSDACVVDVGANIGLFSLQVGQVCEKAKIYAIEPVLDIFQILNTNAKLYGFNIHAFNIGFASHNYKSHIKYYPKMSIMSGMLTNRNEEKNLIQTHIKHVLGKQYETLDESELAELIDTYLDEKTVECHFITLSNFIKANKIKKIDLLKIDVEKNERDVLLGISSDDWKIIQQCVVEVHDQNGSKKAILEMLRNNNFHCKIKQYHTLLDSNIFIIYASKDPLFMTNNALMIYDYQYQWCSLGYLLKDIKSYLKNNLPEYMLPQHYKIVSQLPMTSTGKIDFSQFHIDSLNKDNKKIEYNNRYDDITQTIINVWKTLLKNENIQPDDNIFDMGGTSLMVIQAYILLREILPTGFRMIDFFSYSTPQKLAEKLTTTKKLKNRPIINQNNNKDIANTYDIAVIGYAGIFPGAKNMEQYWYNIANGVDCISHFTNEELKKHGVDANYLNNKNFIRSCGKIDDIDLFDYDFFGITPKEAALMDPQHRIFLEICWKALESSNYFPEKTSKKIGIYAGMGHTHYLNSLYDYHKLKHTYGRDLVIEIANHKDYLVNRVAYKLNLTGASVNINTACSTSLVACVKACQSLLVNENDMVITGGVSLIIPENYGYFYQVDSVLSPDGVCRPFDKLANGTVISSGAGVVVLKKLEDALQDRDNIKAVIKGFAINNDGNEKIGFTAPSVSGQAECIALAQHMANLNGKDITYVEAHGTGTQLGDPIEVEALTKVFGQGNMIKRSCAIGSVKSNIGHADSASGIAGLLKVILMLHYKQIPPSINFHQENEQIDFNKTPFYVNKKLKPWKSHTNLYAGISSFGIGGTNAHIIVTNAPDYNDSNSSHDEHLLIISARKECDLEKIYAELLRMINKNLSIIGDIAYSLQVGRCDFQFRRAWLVTKESAVQELSNNPFGNIDKFNCHNNQWIISVNSWLNGTLINWSQFHKFCKHKHVSIPNYPLDRKKCWYTDINFETKFTSNSVIETLTDIISNLLGIAVPLLDNSNFFNIGGDSLTALSLLEKINDKFQVQITLDEIYEVKTIKNIATIIEKKQLSNSPKITLLKKGNFDSSMILIHPLSGSLYCYDYFVKALDICNIFGIRNEADFNSTHSTIESLASEYIKLIQSDNIKSPYILLGWSFGGTLAYEMARQFLINDIKINHVFMIDSWYKFDKKFNKNESFLKNLFNERLIYLNDSHWAKQWNQTIWQRSKMIFNFNPIPCEIPTTLFKAEILFPEFKTMNDQTNYWSSILGNSLSVINLDADHITIVNEINSLKLAMYCKQRIINCRI